MVFGLSSEKSSESRVDEMRELKNQVKLVELDLEKRMILLENSINSVQKTIGSIEQFESSKDALIEIQETKKTLRELEDTGLISKLETISNNDKINAITDTTEAINEKIKLLSDAIEILSESRHDNKNADSTDPKELSSVKSEITSLKNALSKVSSSMVDPQKLSELDERIASLEDADNALNAELKKTYDIYHEKISFLERRVSSISPASGIPKEIPQDISKIKEEIENLKGINKKLIEMVEINSRAFGNLKNLKAESSKYDALSSMVTDLSMHVADIRKEMKLERAMYPQDIMNLKKEMSNVKSVQKNLVETMESIAKMKHISTDSIKAPDYQNKINDIENAIDDISGRITEVDSLKNDIKTMNNEINSLKANRNMSADSEEHYKKRIESIENDLNAFTSLKDLKTESSEKLHAIINELSTKITDINKEMELERAAYSGDRNDLKKELTNVKAVQKNLVETMEAFTKIKKGRAETQDYQNRLKNIEDSLEKISNEILEISPLKNKMNLVYTEITSLKASKNQRIETNARPQKTELPGNDLPNETNKKIDMLEKSLNQIQGKINDVQILKEELKRVENRITRVEENSDKPQQNSSNMAEISDNEKTLSNMIKSVAGENKVLREEIEQLKQVCAEILKETQQQPIIID